MHQVTFQFPTDKVTGSMKGPVVSHLRLLTIFSLILLNVDKKGTLAARMPISSGKFMLVETPDNKKPLDYLVVDKQNGRKSLIKLETQTNVKGTEIENLGNKYFYNN